MSSASQSTLRNNGGTGPRLAEGVDGGGDVVLTVADCGLAGPACGLAEADCREACSGLFFLMFFCVFTKFSYRTQGRDCSDLQKHREQPALIRGRSLYLYCIDTGRDSFCVRLNRFSSFQEPTTSCK